MDYKIGNKIKRCYTGSENYNFSFSRSTSIDYDYEDKYTIIDIKENILKCEDEKGKIVFLNILKNNIKIITEKKYKVEIKRYVEDDDGCGCSYLTYNNSQEMTIKDFKNKILDIIKTVDFIRDYLKKYNLDTNKIKIEKDISNLLGYTYTIIDEEGYELAEVLLQPI